MKLNELYKKSLLLEEIVRSICFLVLFLTIIIQIIFRLKPIAVNCSYSPIWTEELSRWLFVYIVFLGSSLALHKKEHIGIEIFVDMTPPNVRRVILALVDLLMMACCIIFVYYSLKSFPFAVKQTPMTLPVHNGYLYIIVPVGFSLMFLRIAANFIKDICTFKLKSEGES